MGILYVGESGTPLKEIIKSLGNKSYPYIYERCKWIDETGEEQDEYFGVCAYNAETEELIPLDGDSYSLNDLFESWEEDVDIDGDLRLTVWEKGTNK